jgi:succinate dehydrogenase/fumarate reductase flavoprotein subunit
MPPPPGGSHWVYVFLNPLEEEVTITNAKGEEFLEKYELGRRLPGRKYYGPPWRLHLMAMLNEYREGKGPCYVDFRAPNKSERLREFYGSFFDRTLTQAAFTGTTLDKIKYELKIGGGYYQGGGIRIKPVNSESCIPGLFAGGIVSDLCVTAQYTILTGLMGSMITGRRAGEGAARYALTQTVQEMSHKQVDELKKQIYAPIACKQDFKADDMSIKVIKAWLNIDIRTEKRLKKAIKEFEELEKEASTIAAQDYHELTKCYKVRNYIQCSAAVAASALERRETRLEHIRLDYPLTDNKEWLKWVIVRRSDGKLRTNSEDIPIRKWKYKPEPTVIDRLQLKEEA